MLAEPEIARILAEHVQLGPRKPASYLPLNTVTKHLGMTAKSYVAEIQKHGGVAVVFSPEECPIASGAIFAYHARSVTDVLDQNCGLLRKRDWPTDAPTFIARVAGTWLDDDDPVLAIVRMAFGD